MGHWWNESDRRNQIIGRKIYPITPLCSTNLIWVEMGLNLGLHGERPVTGTAELWCSVLVKEQATLAFNKCHRVSPNPHFWGSLSFSSCSFIICGFQKFKPLLSRDCVLESYIIGLLEVNGIERQKADSHKCCVQKVTPGFYVAVISRYHDWATGWLMQRLNPGRSNRFSHSSKCLNWFWGLPSPPIQWALGFFHSGKVARFWCWLLTFM